MNHPIDHAPDREIAGVIIPWFDQRFAPSESRLSETSGLVRALGCDLAFVRDDRVRNPRPSHLLSQGILDDFASQLRAHQASIAIIDGSLSPIQQRNLERDLQVKVIDRTGLILEIFGLRARTKEGVLQVELARLLYERSRLVRTWTHLERQRGGRGFLAGPGETQLEADKRMLDRALKRLRRDLDEVRRTRGLQRAGRKRRGVPVVALVGYTNAGKSTLFNRLANSDVFAEDMPFATLDPTIRQINLPSLGAAALVDTVGFISDLPTHLIDSFKATLEETIEADLLVHVRDRSSVMDQEQKSDVLSVLEQLEAGSDIELPPIIEAWNKSDLLEPDRQEALRLSAMNGDDAPAILISAELGDGIADLIALIESKLQGSFRAYQILLKPNEGRQRAWLHEHAIVIDETVQVDGSIQMNVQLVRQEFGHLQTRFPDLIVQEV